MESEGPLPHSQETITGPYPEPVEFSPHPHTLFLSDVLITYFKLSLK